MLENFKAWRASGKLRLAPITVLFGTNSAGKTSIPQLLLLLKQTAESSDRQRALHFGDHRTLVDLGDMLSIVHGHDRRRVLRFELDWTLQHPLEIKDAYNSVRHKTSDLRFYATIRGEGEHPQPRVRRMGYEFQSADGEPVRIGLKEAEKKGKYTLETSGYDPVRRQMRAWKLPTPGHFFGFPDEAVAYYQNTGFVNDLRLEMSRLLESIHYVGPLREHPHRLYQWSGETPIHVGSRGERAVEAILAAGDRRFNLGGRKRYKTLDIVVAERLQKMGLIHEFRVVPVARGRKEYEVRVRTKEGASEVLLTDVGFGVSQVLPVIVECFYVPRRSIVIFEQPEIHLHPRVQAELADVFIDAIRAREDGVPRDVQFIIESHSEHFLRRLQRRIAEESLNPEDAALYFVDQQAGEASIHTLEVDKYGRIDNWPDGFFGDALGETEAQMSKMMERMIAEADGA